MPEAQSSRGVKPAQRLSANVRNQIKRGLYIRDNRAPLFIFDACGGRLEGDQWAPGRVVPPHAQSEKFYSAGRTSPCILRVLGGESASQRRAIKAQSTSLTLRGESG